MMLIFFQVFLNSIIPHLIKKITEISERVQNVKIFEDDFLYVSKKFNFGRFVLDKTFIFDLKKQKICYTESFFKRAL